METIEKKRLIELYRFHILDTEPEEELDELTEIASIVCGTPMSLVTLVDKDRTWHKSTYGIDIKEVNREESFCQHVVSKPNEVLIVENALLDKRFEENPFVKVENGIRFYAGAPLVTENGYVLGSLCVVDTKPRKITDSQKKALELLSKKVMDYLNFRSLILLQRKSIRNNTRKIVKIANMIPCVIYQFRTSHENKIEIEFVNEGINSGMVYFDPVVFKNTPESFYEFVHPDDLLLVRKSIEESISNVTEWSIIYRIKISETKNYWQFHRAVPEKKAGFVLWYGTIQNISDQMEYERDIKQILFDISHVLRKPVANLLGLIDFLQNEEFNKENCMEYIGYLKSETNEMDSFIRELTNIYSRKNKEIVEKNVKLLLSEKK